MIKFEPTEEAVARYNRKAALGQAAVTVDRENNNAIYLTYQRFDSDTGQRADDEVQLVVYSEIAYLRDSLTGQRDALIARVDMLNGILGFLDSLLAA